MIILAAPGIDIDVFKSQMRRFGKPSKPFFIIQAKDERALGASQFVGGGETRVSDDPNVAELAALGATVINLSDVRADDPSNHDKFAQLAEVAPGLRGDFERGIGKRSGGAAAESREAVGNTLGSVIALPATLLCAPVRIIAGE